MIAAADCISGLEMRCVQPAVMLPHAAMLAHASNDEVCLLYTVEQQDAALSCSEGGADETLALGVSLARIMRLMTRQLECCGSFRVFLSVSACCGLTHSHPLWTHQSCQSCCRSHLNRLFVSSSFCGPLLLVRQCLTVARLDAHN
jgi:hypothetical protein